MTTSEVTQSDMDERHLCTDYELCPACGLCTACCTGGHDDDQRAEKWKPIPGFSKYEAGDLGHVRGQVSGKVLAARVGTHGYLEVKPYDDDGKRQTRTVHSLVLLTFAGPRPPGMETLHGKGGPLDNRLAEVAEEGYGIRYGTREENLDDWRAAHPPRPRPQKLCARCGDDFTGNGKRCHPCVVAIGEEAARLLQGGVTLGAAAEQLEYPSVDGLHTLAVKYGGYGIERPHWSQRVIATVRHLLPVGNAK